MDNKEISSIIFQGIKNQNCGFDLSTMFYCNETDFFTVLERVKSNNIDLYGIEVWLDGVYYGFTTYDEYNLQPSDPNWYNSAFNDFIKDGEKKLLFSISFAKK